MDENNVEKLLLEILDEIRLLTIREKSRILIQFKDEFLTSDNREQMYAAFDGEKTLPQISEEIDCNIRTLQKFSKELIEKDLVEFELSGNTKIIRKSLSKIAQFYMNRELEGLDNG